MAVYAAGGLPTGANFTTDAAGNVRPIGATETTVANFIATQAVANGAPTGTYSTVPESFIKAGAELHVVEIPPPSFWRAQAVQDMAPPPPKGKGRGKGKFTPQGGVPPDLTGVFGRFQRGRIYVPALDAEMQKASAGALPGAEAAANAGLRQGLVRTLAWVDLAVHGLSYDDAQPLIGGYPDVFMWGALMGCVDVVEPHMAVAYALPNDNGVAPAPWDECHSGLGAVNAEVRQLARQAAGLVPARYTQG